MNYKWFEIGILLGIPRSKLMGFKKEDDPLAAVVDYWLRNMENPSWESLASAVGSNHVNEIGFAKRIREKYCQQGDNVGGQGENPLRTITCKQPQKNNTHIKAMFDNSRICNHSRK